METKSPLIKNYTAREIALGKDVLDLANAIVVVLGIRGEIQFFNKAAEKITGYNRNELLGKNWFDVVVPKENYGYVFEEFIRNINEGLTESYENPILTKSSEERFISWKVSPLKSGNDIIGVITFGIDITDRKNLEEKLKHVNGELEKTVYEKTEEYKNILDRITDGVASIDKNWNYNYINERGAELLNTNAANLIGSNLWQYFPDATKLPLGESMKIAMVEQHYVYSENYYAPLDRWYENHFFPSEQGMTNLFRDITKKKKTEAALHASEEKFRMLIENSHDAICLLNKEGEILFLSPAGERITGYTANEMLGRKIFDFFHPETRSLNEFFENVYSNPGIAINHTGTRLLHKNGNYIQIEANVTNLLNDENVKAIIANFRDVTERIIAEKALEKSEEKFRMLIENSHDAILQLTETGEIKYISPAGEKISGYKANEVNGKNIFDFFHPEGFQYGKKRFEEIIKQQGNIFSDTIRLLHKSGKYIWIETTIANQLQNENVKTIIANFRDITEKIKAEEELKKSEEKFRMLIENSHDAISLMNEKGEVTYLSPAGEKITGYTANEVIGRNIFEFFHPDGSPIAEQVFEKLYKEPGKTVNRTNRLLHKNGNYIRIESNVTNLLQDENVKAIISNFRDITDRINAEEALEKSKLNYKFLIEQAPDGVFISDANDFIIDVNAKGCKMLGYELAELQKLKVTELIATENLKLNPVRIDDYKAGKTIIIERQLIRKDGKEIKVEISGKMLDDGRYQSFVRDITERKRIENELQKSEHNYRTLIEQAPDGIFISNADFFIESVNTSGCKMLGYELLELQKLKFTDILSAEDLKKNPLKFNELIAGKIVIAERKALRKDGTEIQIEISTKLLSDGRYQAFARDITERKRIEKELQKSEINYRTLIEQAPDGIFISGKGQLIKDVNASGCKMLGYELNELQEMEFADLIEPENLKNLPLQNEELKIGKSLIIERILIRKDKTKVPVEISSKMLNDGRFQSFIRDISERKRIEKELQKTEQHYKILVDQAPDGIFLSGTNFLISEANSSGCKMLGYELKELQKMNIASVFSLEDLEKNPFNWEKYIDGKTIISERVLVRKDGIEFPVEISAKLLSDGRYQAFVRDISERKRIELELQKTELQYKILVEQAPDGVFISGTDHHILQANDSGCKMLGYELNELQKMKFMDLISPENLKKYPVKFGELKSGNTVMSERILVKKDGAEFPVEISAKLLSDGRFQSFVRDISERKKTKMELREKNIKLRNLTAYIQNAREEERKYIAREIHDELGQMLTGLKIDLSWLNKKIDPGADEQIKKIEEMLDMTDKTIQSVRKIATELRPGILDDLGLEEAIIWQVNEFQTRTGVACKLIGKLTRQKFDPLLSITAFRILQESLTNIMRHAKATQVIIKMNDDSNTFNLEIVDNGIGISLEEMKEKKSLGILGMKERASIIGGMLSISSGQNNGTTINIVIPLKLSN